ncbi:hypothetical protein P152DRAFT_469840 [Eremomyces bilateralis CBS 781.70]|uniref:Thioredoxin-like protein n=1 Tax=Eremomyces bilateralis CBS 781.70 TaxID=1392243 RepID=A0A6G1GHP6_9PEZI|nr:uncharacterized protein P152DRAFT_469840 [Eremomyces bilateralis CBS 781.70]KAF1817399.1 hypothetical protein P152DRAFT_469840 [Eremomyces bilateralis CBS 781.70]
MALQASWRLRVGFCSTSNFVLRQCCRQFSATKPAPTPNRIYTSVRTPDELHTLTLLSASSRRPLITLWTARYNPNSIAVAPTILELIETEGCGQSEGGVGYAEVEFDSVIIGDLPLQIQVATVPTLLAFSRQEPQLDTKVTSLEQLRDKTFLRKWIETEARRGGEGGAGGRLWPF